MAPEVAERSAGLAQRAGLVLAEALRRDRGAGEAARGPADPEATGGAAPGAGRGRRRAPGSAAALTVSSFGPWRACPERLPLGGAVGFKAFQFDVRCPTGLRGTPPHLELLGLRPDHAVAVVARCTEYLAPRRAPVAPTYDRLLAQGAGLAPWHAQLRELRQRSDVYRHLDAGALVKHALALARNFPDRPVTLVYLYWEPLDAAAFPEFGRHRDELRRFAAIVDGAAVAFRAHSFDDLWREWATLSDGPEWLADHLWRLRARYAVAIGCRAGLYDGGERGERRRVQGG